MINRAENTRTAAKLALVAVAMFGFGYALVPIYDVFCEIAGINGKTGQISKSEADRTAIDTDRLVTVEFDTNVNSELPWKFKSAQRKLRVYPGKVYEAVFYAENLSGETVIGQAVPSVAPFKASIYFNKTECFCFTQQALAPGERKAMPVRFIVDPGLPASIKIMTLSYTFFKAPPSVAELKKAETKTRQRS